MNSSEVTIQNGRGPLTLSRRDRVGAKNFSGCLIVVPSESRPVVKHYIDHAHVLATLITAEQFENQIEFSS